MACFLLFITRRSRNTEWTRHVEQDVLVFGLKVGSFLSFITAYLHIG